MKWLRLPTHVFLVMQPPFLFVPVEVEGPWYANYGYQFALELEKYIKRPKRFVELVIAGIAALISLIATATVSTVALTQSVHTTEHVNRLSQNVSRTLRVQKTIDHKILTRLDGLKEAVEYLGTQLSILKNQMSLVCHGAFQHICMTPLPVTNLIWEKVQRHLQGIWHDTNLSLDLLKLQQQISAIGHAHVDVLNPDDLAKKIITSLQGFNLGNILQHSFWIFMIIGVILLIIICMWCCFCKKWKGFAEHTEAHLYLWQLKQKGGDVVSPVPRKS